MESSEASQDRFILVVCPGCKEPLYPGRDQAGSTIACPGCGRDVLIPKSTDSAGKMVEQAEAKIKPAVAEYGIHDADYVAEQVEYIRIVCPTCGTLLYAEPRQEGQAIVCPDCHTKTAVRRGAERPAPREPRPETIGEYEVLDDGAATRISSDDYFLLLCPECNARLHPSRKLIGKRVRCPDCRQPVRVPEAPPRKEQHKPAPVEAYGLEAADAQRLGVEHYFAFACPKCSARLKSLREQAGQRIECPDCGVKIRVPEAPARRTSQPLERVVEHTLSDEIMPTPPMREPVQPDAIAHRIELDAPPEWTFFSGVFDFPWRRGAISRWGLISMGLTADGLVIVAGLLISGIAGGGMNLMAGFSLAFFGMVALWLSIWTFSFAAQCMLAIVQETAAGADEIQAWPEADWREWIWPLLQLGYQVAVAAALGYGLSRLAGLWLPQTGVVWAAGMFVLFPVLLLSSLEADSPFMPLSQPVLKSLLTCWWGWLMLYLLSGLMWAGFVELLLGLVSLNIFLVPIVGGPVLAAVLLVHARLLGRLAWRATT